MLLRALSDALGVSGNEQEIRDLIYREVKDLADEVRVDAIGNLIAVKRARRARAGEEPWRVMIAAHMDEIGFMVKQIDSNGLLKFDPVGGIDPRVVLGKPVVVGKGRIPGVIGVKPIHLQEPDESRRVISFDQLTIDVGASGKDELDGVVRIGDYAAFNFAFEELDPAPGYDPGLAPRYDPGLAPGYDPGLAPGYDSGLASGGLRAVMGKALDDRAGCAVLIELLKGDYPFDLHAVFTVQEEVGLRGARVAAYAVNPRMAFVLETTVCDDLPKKKDISRITRMGAGPAITISDRTVVAAKGLVARLIATAEREGIPYQFKSPNVGGTDAGAIHLAQSGIPSAVVSMPCRYLHSMVTMLSLNDFDKVLQLMQATLLDLTPDAPNP